MNLECIIPISTFDATILDRKYSSLTLFLWL